MASAAQIVSEIIRPLPHRRLRSLPNMSLAASLRRIADTALMNATKEMQEMSQSFNLQYLQLQKDMQQENRQFTLVSNIMKTKHDTVENAIDNVR